MAQVLEAPVKGFQYSEVDRATSRRRFFLSGDYATNVSNVELVLAGARLVVFDDEGKTNLIVMSPHCRYHTDNKTISSSGRLQVATGDGQFAIEGEGFEWNQAVTRLTISNQVHAILRKDLVAAQTSPQTAAGSVPIRGAAPLSAAAPEQLIQIYADEFQFVTNGVVFHGNVRVDEAEGKLTCGLLTGTFSGAGRSLEMILAQQNVALESGDIHATGEQAEYHLADDVLRMKENPTLRIGPREGRARELVFYRRTRVFHASDNVEMKLPAGAIGLGGSLPGGSTASTNVAETKGPPVQVLADDFQFGSDAVETNVSVAVFTGHVRVNDERAKLRCESMTLRSAAASGRTESVVAERSVVVEQAENRVTADKAVYSATSESILMTGGPTWNLGSREGRAEILAFDLKNRAYQAKRDVQMRLPPGAWPVSLASSACLKPTLRFSGPESGRTGGNLG